MYSITEKVDEYDGSKGGKIKMITRSGKTKWNIARVIAIRAIMVPAFLRIWTSRIPRRKEESERRRINHRKRMPQRLFREEVIKTLQHM